MLDTELSGYIGHFFSQASIILCDVSKFVRYVRRNRCRQYQCRSRTRRHVLFHSHDMIFKNIQPATVKYPKLKHCRRVEVWNPMHGPGQNIHDMGQKSMDFGRVNKFLRKVKGHQRHLTPLYIA